MARQPGKRQGWWLAARAGAAAALIATALGAEIGRAHV